MNLLQYALLFVPDNLIQPNVISHSSLLPICKLQRECIVVNTTPGAVFTTLHF
jgi:hypothetical protein